MHVSVVNRTRKPLGISEQRLSLLAVKVIALSKAEGGHVEPTKNIVELVIASSAQVKALNTQYRGKVKTTDVLSFISEIPHVLGSIVIDRKVAERQATEYDHSVKREILELFCHGLFHLLGYDHETPRQARIMRNLESQMENYLNRLTRRG